MFGNRRNAVEQGIDLLDELGPGVDRVDRGLPEFVQCVPEPRDVRSFLVGRGVDLGPDGDSADRYHRLEPELGERLPAEYRDRDFLLDPQGADGSSIGAHEGGLDQPASRRDRALLLDQDFLDGYEQVARSQKVMSTLKGSAIGTAAGILIYFAVQAF